MGTVDGICQGIQRFFTARGLASSDIVLTWDVNTKKGDQRRAQACGSQYCTAQQSLLRQTTGDKTIEISCDEFPFASTEEGGNYYQTLPVNPTSPQLTCVPAWQNTLQGNCNGKSQSRPACSSNSSIYIYIQGHFAKSKKPFFFRDIDQLLYKHCVLQTWGRR